MDKVLQMMDSCLMLIFLSLQRINTKKDVVSKKGHLDCFLSVFFFFNHDDQIMGKCPVRFAHKKTYLIFYLSQIIDDTQILRRVNRVCP